MKTLNLTFTEKEYEAMLKIKRSRGFSWERLMLRYVLGLAEYKQLCSKSERGLK